MHIHPVLPLTLPLIIKNQRRQRTRMNLGDADYFHKFQSAKSVSGQSRKASILLTKIPRSALEKLWQKSINASFADSLSLSEEIASCTHPMTSTPLRGAAGGRPPLRLTRKLSSKMLLEIETDPESGKALSLRLITDDDSGISGIINSTASESKELGQMSSPVLGDDLSGCTANHNNCTSQQQQQQQHHSFAPAQHNFSSSATVQAEKRAGFSRGTTTTASDSGLSSSLQSPSTVSSSNSASIDYQCYSVPADQRQGDKDSPQASTVRPAVLKMPEPTHRALYKFCARHEDELELQIGDAVHVIAEHDDQWSEGVNLRTGQQGIFPASLVTDLEYSQFTVDAASLSTTGCNLFASASDQKQKQLLPPSLNFRIKRERYLLDFLGSIEVTECKGEEVLNEAISRVSARVMLESEKTATTVGDNCSTTGGNLMMSTPCQCILEISDIGLRMMDGCSSRRGSTQRLNLNSQSSKPSEQLKSAQHIDYFFSLMQITFCGYKLKSDVYFFAFITRHPADKGRYAAHVFRAPESTREVAEAVGQAFHRFYNHFVEVSLPLETFYLDD